MRHQHQHQHHPGLALLQVARLAAGTCSRGDAARAPAASHAVATVLRSIRRRGFTRRGEQQLRQAARAHRMTRRGLDVASAAAALLDLHERQLLELAHRSMTGCATLRRGICKGETHRGRLIRTSMPAVPARATSTSVRRPASSPQSARPSWAKATAPRSWRP